MLFLIARALIRPGGILRWLARPGAAKVGRALGDATLGVFGLHLTVLLIVLSLPVLGGDPAADRALWLVLRVVAVVTITYAIVLPLRRVPVVNRVL